ncbi:MAG: ABC transporter permease, partial [Planctomycetota bacterium]
VVACGLIAATTISAAVCHLLLTTTAAQLTPESENRSSPIRWSLLLLTWLVVTITALGVLIGPIADDDIAIGFMIFSSMILAALWTFASALMAAESDSLTPRIQRELPGNFMSRLLLTFFTPGPATGLVFATLALVTLVGTQQFGLSWIAADSRIRFSVRDQNLFANFSVAYVCYLILFLNLVRWIVAIVRINNHPRVEVGAAALVVVAVLTALVPYSIGLHWNDYRPYTWSYWQITNWFWTLGLISESNVPIGVMPLLIFAAVMAVLFSLASVGVRALPIRTATPEAVLEERDRSTSKSKPT